MIQPSRETEQAFRSRVFFVWGARRAKYPRRPRRVALWGDLGGVQFSVTEVNREGRAPARPRALSIAASKLFRIIISEAIVTEVDEISLRKTEIVGRVQAGRTGISWKDEKRWGGFSAPRAEGGAGTSRAGPVWGEHLWERGQGRDPPARRSRPFGGAYFVCGGARHGHSPRKATLFYHSRRGTDKSGNEPEKNDLCITQLRTDICGLCYTVARNEQAVQSST